MGSIEAGDNSRSVSRRQFAPSDETIALLYSSDAPRTGKLAKSDTPELAVLFTREEPTGRNIDLVQPDQQTSSLVRSLTPKEMATALATVSERFTDPKKLAEAREYEKTAGEVEKRVEAFRQEFQSVYGRPLEMQEIRDPQQRAKLLQGHPELEARWMDFQKYAVGALPKKAAHDASLRPLQAEGQKAVDDICARLHLPPVKFEFTRANMMRDHQSKLSGAYLPGKIFIPEQQLADESFNRSALVDTIAHEAKHHEQLVLMTAKSIEDIAGDKPLDARQIKALQSKYKNEFEVELTEKFILDVQQWKNGHTLTKEERDRASSYELSHVRTKAAGEKEDQIALLTTIDKTAKETSAWAAIKMLDQSEKKLPAIPKDVMEAVLEQYRKIKAGQAAPATWNEKDAKDMLDIVTNVWIANLGVQVLRERRASVTENEAKKAGLEAAEAAK